VPWPCSWTSAVGDVKKIKMKTFPPFPGLGNGQYIQTINKIEIGANVRLGPGVKLISANHDFFDFERHLNVNSIVLGDNCWIGAGAVILPGVSLGYHVIVAAGAIVTKSFKQNDILLAGNPAKIVKNIGSYRGNWDHTWLLDNKTNKIRNL